MPKLLRLEGDGTVRLTLVASTARRRLELLMRDHAQRLAVALSFAVIAGVATLVLYALEFPPGAIAVLVAAVLVTFAGLFFLSLAMEVGDGRRLRRVVKEIIFSSATVKTLSRDGQALDRGWKWICAAREWPGCIRIGLAGWRTKLYVTDKISGPEALARLRTLMIENGKLPRREREPGPDPSLN